MESVGYTGEKMKTLVPYTGNTENERAKIMTKVKSGQDREKLRRILIMLLKKSRTAAVLDLDNRIGPYRYKGQYGFVLSLLKFKYLQTQRISSGMSSTREAAHAIGSVAQTE